MVNPANELAELRNRQYLNPTINPQHTLNKQLEMFPTATTLQLATGPVPLALGEPNFEFNAEQIDKTQNLSDRKT